MKISTKLFNQQQVSRFGKLNEDIQSLQNKISTGKNIVQASDDPIGAVNLSGLQQVKERFSQYSNTDSICYSDWTVIGNSSESRSWSIDGDDSATVHIYWDMEVVTTFKAYKDTLIINVSYGNIPVTREKAIKIDSFDFSPSCSDYFF